MTQTKPAPDRQLAGSSADQSPQEGDDILAPRPSTGKRITRGRGGDDVSNGYWIHDNLGPKHNVGPDSTSKSSRSSEEIIAEIEDRLASDLYLDASAVHLSFDGSVLTLAGGVDNEEDRRKVGTWAVAVTRGTFQVMNRLRVRGTAPAARRDEDER